jgi:hypothetical protein
MPQFAAYDDGQIDEVADEAIDHHTMALVVVILHSIIHRIRVLPMALATQRIVDCGGSIGIHK